MTVAADDKIRVGPKGRVVTIPDGFRRITDGVVAKGDLYANVFSAKFYEVESDDLGLPVEAFECLIRAK